MKKRISCYGKIKHRNRLSAVIASKKLKHNKNLISKIYLCQRCGFYHVGKPSFLDNPSVFWQNIFHQMSQHDLEKLKGA